MERTELRLCTASNCVFNIIAKDQSPMCGLKEIIIDSNGQCIYSKKKIVDKDEYPVDEYHIYSTGKSRCRL